MLRHLKNFEVKTVHIRSEPHETNYSSKTESRESLTTNVTGFIESPALTTPVLGGPPNSGGQKEPPVPNS